MELCQLYQAVLERMTAAVYVRDLDRNLLYINPAAERLVGWSCQEATERKCFQLFGDEALTCRENCPAERAILEGRTVLLRPGRLKMRSGEIKEAKISASPLYDDERPLGAIVIVEQIVSLQDMEPTRIGNLIVREKEIEQGRLALLNDIGSRIATDLELDGVLRRAAVLVHECFGYHHVALFTLNREHSVLVMRARAGAFDAIFPDDHRIPLGQGMVGWVGLHGERLLANNVRDEPSYVNFYPDLIPTLSELSVPIQKGEKLLGVLDVQSPLLDAFGESDVMVMETLADQIAVAMENAQLYGAVQQELAERERVTQALWESEERYRTIAENIQDGLTIVERGKVVHVNDRACEIFGYPRDELVELDGLDLAAPQGREGPPPDMIIAAEGDTPLREQECWIARKDGTRRCVHNRYSIIRKDDQITSYLVATTDITDRKEMAQQILQAERLAAMGYVATTLAHEIKNPLQAIHSNLELVLDYPLEPDERDDHLRLCNREVESLIKITRRVLSFASVDREPHRPTSMTELVQHALDLLRKPLQTATVQVTTHFAPDLPSVLVAPDQMTQVLLNLLINMIEAMPNGGLIDLAARVEPSRSPESGQEALVLTLVNDGPPIPPEHLGHVFDPFFTTKPGGTGLGLFITHNIVQQHGGTLTVKNLEDDWGVAFTLSLPPHRLVKAGEPVP
jgi:two-component system NtrC family sensor kinase